jgi:hypothetical protein
VLRRNLPVDPKMLFNRRDADFKLKMCALSKAIWSALTRATASLAGDCADGRYRLAAMAKSAVVSANVP